MALTACVGRSADTEADRARARFESRAAGVPSRVQEGAPERSEPLPPELMPEEDPACPSALDAGVRASEGTDCSSYRAEIIAWAGGCVERCDELGTALLAVRLAMGTCSQWCSERSCPTATFIPPPDGCAIHQCYEGSEECPDETCSLREYCSLLDTHRVWNCFCTDLVPT
ncbi:MAG: hypothetical protein R2991_11725 [Thermoanaerobaculia bacterium]